MRALLVGAVLSLTVAGCVSMPSGGPVLPYAVTQSANGQTAPYLQIIPPSPGQGWSPAQVVAGFLAASASFVGQHEVAKEYLTPGARRAWQPNGAIVFKKGPTVTAQTPVRKGHTGQQTASVMVGGGDIQATLSEAGTYVVAAATTKGLTFRYDLEKHNGQWRISNLGDNRLLLTHTEFAADYQLRNLYFFTPANDKLVPDPVYVPLQATQAALMNGLVQDLISQPLDWLGKNEATRTAFPKGTSLVGNVTVDGGTASVTLGGAAARAPAAVKEQIFSQLSWTLDGAGQGQQQVQSIALYIGDRAFAPPSAQGNAPVRYAPVNNPHGPVFYYLGTGGQLMRASGSSGGKPVKVATIGTGYTGLAVSPDGQYVAALRSGNVYTGQVGASKLTFRPVGSGFSSLSWDKNDYLWAAGGTGLVIVSAAAKTVGASALVSIQAQAGAPCGSDLSDVTGVRVAPDGVRIALVFGGQQQALAFGAIVMASQTAAAQNPPQASVRLSPFVVCGQPDGGAFKSLSWYGAEDVVALTQPGDALIEYPVNGGTSTIVQGGQGARSVTAYYDGSVGGFVAGLGDDAMSMDTSVVGPWSQLNYPGELPTYPG